MKKVKEFFHRQYKVLIPVMVVVLLLIVLLFFYKEYQYDNYRNKVKENVFQYFNSVRFDYTAEITYNLKDAIVGVRAIDEKINYDATPIYYRDEKKVLFPQEMTIVFPLSYASQYKLYRYATYYTTESFQYIKNNLDTSQYNKFFLYDGKKVFFFPDEVKLLINDKEYKTLSPMSYVSIVGNTTLTYFDYEKEESEFIEIEKKNIKITAENMMINLTERYVESFGEEILLFPPNNLKPVFKTIDK